MNVMRLTNDPQFDASPKWSPDGTLIAFHSGRDSGGSGDIFVMGADGSDQTNLTQNSITNDLWPEWERLSLAVGGELIPLDTTALIIGYSVLNAYWIAPIGIGIGVGIYLVKRRF